MHSEGVECWWWVDYNRRHHGERTALQPGGFTAAKAVQAFRKRRGISQRALCREVGVSLSYVAKVESGELADISVRSFARLALVLGLNPLECYCVIVAEAHRTDATTDRELLDA